MKRLSQSQRQNLIFIGAVVLVAAAVLIYTLFGGKLTVVQPAAADATPTAEPTKQPRVKCVGAPVSVMLASLESDKRLTAANRSENEYALYLAGEPETQAAKLCLTESNGSVTSLSWYFTLPAEPQKKPENDIEKRLAENHPDELAALRTRVEVSLTACISAGDLNGLLLEPVQLIWVEEALETAETGTSYRNVTEDCVFTAYRSERNGEPELFCTLIFS